MAPTIGAEEQRADHYMAHFPIAVSIRAEEKSHAAESRVDYTMLTSRLLPYSHNDRPENHSWIANAH